MRLKLPKTASAFFATDPRISAATRDDEKGDQAAPPACPDARHRPARCQPTGCGQSVTSLLARSCRWACPVCRCLSAPVRGPSAIQGCRPVLHGGLANSHSFALTPPRGCVGSLRARPAARRPSQGRRARAARPETRWCKGQSSRSLRKDRTAAAWSAPAAVSQTMAPISSPNNGGRVPRP